LSHHPKEKETDEGGHGHSSHCEEKHHKEEGRRVSRNQPKL
jgi:hypothetical protein